MWLKLSLILAVSLAVNGLVVNDVCKEVTINVANGQKMQFCGNWTCETDENAVGHFKLEAHGNFP